MKEKNFLKKSTKLKRNMRKKKEKEIKKFDRGFTRGRLKEIEEKRSKQNNL